MKCAICVETTHSNRFTCQKADAFTHCQDGDHCEIHPDFRQVSEKCLDVSC